MSMRLKIIFSLTLFVSEVFPIKSQLMILVVLRSLCRNPDGLFWAGDTAQTISVGSSFRFNDLKAFLFRLEVRPSYPVFICYSPTSCVVETKGEHDR